MGSTWVSKHFLYVDELVIVDADLEEISRVKSQLAASFEMKDLTSRDRSDLHPETHTNHSMTLCIEYALQVRNDEL